MDSFYSILLTDEIVGAALDLDREVEPTASERALLSRLRPEDIRGATFHRLMSDWASDPAGARVIPAGTLVIYDGQEVLLFLKPT